MRAITILLLSLILLSVRASGQSLDEYLSLAAENNPNLKAKYLQYQAALEKVPQVGTLPDPQLSFSFFVMPMERYIGNQVGSISLMQMFPWFGTLNTAKQEMTFMAKAKFEEFNEARSELFYEIKINWFALNLLEKEIEITKENIEILKIIEEIALARYQSGGQSSAGNSKGSVDMNTPMNQRSTSSESGMAGMGVQGESNASSRTSTRSMSTMQGGDNMSSSGTMVDVLRVQIERNELENNLALLQDSKVPLLANLNQLLNRSLDEPVMLSQKITEAEMPIPIAHIADSIRHNNPMIKMLEQMETAYISQGEMNRKMGLPMIGLGLQYEIFRPRDNVVSSMNGKNMLMPMATVTIPLWRKKYNASIKEADYLRQSVIEQKQDVGNSLMVNYQEVLKDFNDANRRTNLYRKQTSLLNQVYNILIVQYKTEGSSFEELLRVQQQLLDYRLKELDSLVDGNIAAAMIERLMGR
jgi:outer membrane protein TolC